MFTWCGWCDTGRREVGSEIKGRDGGWIDGRYRTQRGCGRLADGPVQRPSEERWMSGRGYVCFMKNAFCLGGRGEKD